MRKIRSFKKGFTLIEILVVIAILSLVGILVLTIFTRTLRGTNKSQILGAIKQNGQSVLETMTNTVRNSDDVVCPKIIPPAMSVYSETLVVVQNSVYTRFRIISEDSAELAQCNSLNGCIVVDFPAQPPPPSEKSIIQNFIDSVCTDSIGTDSTESPRVITDTNPQSGVSLQSGSFSLNRQAGFKDNVKVTFVLSAGVEVLPALAGEIDPVTFETTIQLR